MKAATVALRDQICEVLRAEGRGALTTMQVGEHMAPKVSFAPRHVGCDRAPNPDTRYHPIYENVCLGDAGHRLTRPMTNTEVYPHLRALERQRLVARVHVDDMRAVFWTWTGPPADHVDELESAWSAS